MTIKLSICIPTYNFGPFIGQTLDSILPQLTPEVEVIILDGGSTDQTAEEVTARQRNCPQLTFHPQGFRGGIDRDIEKVVSFAKGEYCWLFSADDTMVTGAINKVLEAIKSEYDVYICEHVICNIDMQPVRAHPPFNTIHQPRLFNLGDTEQKKEYFRLARTSEAFFSFLSGPIFKKEVWDSADIPDSFRSTCWIVAGHLLTAMQKGMTVQYLHEVFIHKREGNDSFSGGSLVKWCTIFIANFQHIIDFIFGKNSEEAFHIRRVLQRDIPFRALLLAKVKTIQFPEKENIETLQHLVKLHYADLTLANQIKYMLFQVAHPSLLKMIWHVRQSLRKIMKGHKVHVSLEKAS